MEEIYKFFVEDALKRLIKSSTITAMYEEGDVLFGVLLGHQSSQSKAHIHLLYVVPSRQGQRIAHHLVEMFCRRLPDQTEVYVESDQAHMFWLKMGFANEGATTERAPGKRQITQVFLGTRTTMKRVIKKPTYLRGGGHDFKAIKRQRKATKPISNRVPGLDVTNHTTTQFQSALEYGVQSGNKLFNLTKDVFLTTFNVRSLRSYARKATRPNIFSEYHDVIVLTEVQGKPEEVFKFLQLHAALSKFKGRFWSVCSSSHGSGYSGVAIFVQTLPNQVLYNFLVPESYNENPLVEYTKASLEAEGRIITILYEDYTIIGVYCPTPWSPDKENVKKRKFHQLLNLHIAELKKQERQVIVIGDINIVARDIDSNAADPLIGEVGKSLDDRTDYTQLLAVCGGYDAAVRTSPSSSSFTWYPEPSWRNQNRNAGMRIDMFILPEELKCKLYRVFSWLRGSDHRPISCVISQNPETSGLYTDVGALPLLTELLPRTVLLNEASEGTLQRIAALLAGEAQDHPEDNFEILEIDGAKLQRSMDNVSRRSTAPMVIVRCCGVVLNVLVDTGSTYNLLSYDWACTHLKNFKSKLKPVKTIELTVGDGRSMFPEGYLMLNFEICDQANIFRPTRQKFLVLRQCVEKLIIGHQFFEENRSFDLSYTDGGLVQHKDDPDKQLVIYPWTNSRGNIIRNDFHQLRHSDDINIELIANQDDDAAYEPSSKQLAQATFEEFLDLPELIEPSSDDDSDTDSVISEGGINLEEDSDQDGALDPSYESLRWVDAERTGNRRYVQFDSLPVTGTWEEDGFQSCGSEKRMEGGTDIASNETDSTVSRLRRARDPYVSQPVIRTTEGILVVHDTKDSACRSQHIPKRKRGNRSVRNNMIPFGVSSAPSSELLSSMDLCGDDHIVHTAGADCNSKTTICEDERERVKVSVLLDSSRKPHQSVTTDKDESQEAPKSPETETVIDENSDLYDSPITMHTIYDATLGKERPKRGDELDAKELEQFRQDLKSPRLSESVLRELWDVPVVSPGADVPNYFNEDGQLDDAKMPSYLKGLRYDGKNTCVSRKLVNLFIYECCVLPPGRENFFSPDNIPGKFNGFEVQINLLDDKPWQSHLRSLSPADLNDFYEVLCRYLKLKLCEPSHSNTVNGALLVRKANGRHQLALSSGKLNEKSKKDCYPLPLIQSNLDNIGSSPFLSAIDICGAYLSLPVRESDRDKLAFITHFGLFRWTVVPYGWKNAGASFCFAIDTSLAGLKYQILVTYSDDIMVNGGQFFRHHLRCLNVTFNRLQKSGFHVSIAKCQFFQRMLDYLGYTLSQHGVQPSKKNVDKIMKMDIKNMKNLRSFLGSTMFYKRLIEYYCQITAPLHQELSKAGNEKQLISTSAAKTVDELKKILSSYPVLRFPDFSKRFILQTDASKHGFGAVLMQEDDAGVTYVIAYASARLTPAQQKLTSSRLECAASVWAMVYFKHYLVGRKFLLRTDNLTLKWIKKQDDADGTFGRLLIEAQEFDFDIEHIPGKKNVVADLLSRLGAKDAEFIKPEIAEGIFPPRYCSVMEKSPFLMGFDDWQAAQREPDVQKILEQLRINVDDPDSSMPAHFTVRQGLLHYRGNHKSAWRVFVPSKLRNRLLCLMHNSLGHRGARPLMTALASRVYWPSMRASIASFVRGCPSCQRRKPTRPLHSGKTGTLVVESPLESIDIDFMHSKLPSSNGFEYCLCAIDRFTRYVWAMPLKTKGDPHEIATILWREIFSCFGLPQRCHSDNDVVLIQEAMNIIFTKLGVHRTTITYRHPNGNAVIERFMRFLNAAFTTCLAKYSEWAETTPLILFAYRTMAHEVTGFSPFYLMYGRDPILPLDVTLTPETARRHIKAPPTHQDVALYAEKMTSSLKKIFIFVRERQLRASLRNAERRDEKRVDVEYSVGDMVLFWDPNDSLYSVTCDIRKLRERDAPRAWKFPWSGPHVITTKVNDCTYTLFHTRRQETIRVNVENLRPFVQKEGAPKTKKPDQATTMPKAIDIIPTIISSPPVAPEKGDLVFIILPKSKNEGFTVARYLRKDTTYGHIVQWMGELRSYDTAEDRITKTRWFNGWFQPSTAQYYWLTGKQHAAHYEYTNESNEIFIRDEYILASKFKLNNNHRLPTKLALDLLQRWKDYLKARDAKLLES